MSAKHRFSFIEEEIARREETVKTLPEEARKLGKSRGILDAHPETENLTPERLELNDFLGLPDEPATR